jgi:hypothetical protein
VYSEYGDPVKVVRQEKENLPAPKENEVFVHLGIKAKFIGRLESLYGLEWTVFDVITEISFLLYYKYRRQAYSNVVTTWWVS